MSLLYALPICGIEVRSGFQLSPAYRNYASNQARDDISTPNAAPLTQVNHSEIGFASAVWARLVLATPAKARLVSARKERFRCRGRDFRTGQARAYRARARPFVRPHSPKAVAKADGKGVV